MKPLLLILAAATLLLSSCALSPVTVTEEPNGEKRVVWSWRY